MTEANDQWLLVKRGLYYMPNDCGYTGIKDHAAVYSGEEARERLLPGVSMIKRLSAPEFSEACFDDLARAHLSRQRDAALAEVDRLRAALSDAINFYDGLDRPHADGEAELLDQMSAAMKRGKSA